MDRKRWELPLVFVIFFICSTVGAAKDGKSVMCFYEIDRVGMRDQTRFNLRSFDVKLCTHLVYSLIRLDIETNEVKYAKILNESGKNGNLTAELKTKNPGLKILINLNLDQNSYNMNEIHIKIMANTSHVDETAKKVVDLLDQHKFDGIHFEHFFSHDVKNGIANLISSLKKAFLPKGHILAYVGNRNEDEIDEGYDIPKLSQNIDLLILETYNFHDASIESKWADHHAPLYNRPWDTENKTVDFLVSLWISKGFPANKILLTIPLWGRSWKLSSNETNPPAPANGKGKPGRQTSWHGFLSYFEICENINKNNWQVFQDEDKTMGPYAVSPSDTSPNRIWVGYDDPAMAVIKSKYIKAIGLGGAAVRDICYDDIDDRCDGGKYPVLTAIQKTLSSPDHTVIFWIIGCLFIVILIVIALLVLSYIFYQRKLTGRGRERTNSQVNKIKDVVTKGFDSLKKKKPANRENNSRNSLNSLPSTAPPAQLVSVRSDRMYTM